MTMTMEARPPRVNAPRILVSPPSAGRQRLGRLLAEFVTIVAGVLVALAAHAGVQARSDRALERQYLTRLRASITQDLEQNRQAQLLIEAEKWPAIGYLHDVIADTGVVPEPVRLIAALDSSASLGWAAPTRAATVYHELVTTGRLPLILDPELRSAVAGYYDHATLVRELIHARRTDYPRAIVALVPARARTLMREGRNPDENVVQLLTDRIRQPSFRELLNAEEYYAHFVMQSLEDDEDRAQQMLQLLERALLQR